MGVALLSGATMLASPAAAQTNPVTATGKGVTGGMLLGAELGTMPQALLGVETWWAYAVGGGVGAVAGGVGGYFVETKVTSAQPSLYLLAGGMALIIPTVVLTLNATSYKPEAEEGEFSSEDALADSSEPFTDSPADASSGDAPAPVAPPSAAPAAPESAPPAPVEAAPPSESPAPQSRSKRPRARRRPELPMSLVSLDFGKRGVGLRPGVPAIDVRPIYSVTEVAQFGVSAGTEVQFPVLGGRF